MGIGSCLRPSINPCQELMEKKLIQRFKQSHRASVDKGRVLICILVTNNSFREEVKLNISHTDRTEFSSQSDFTHPF